MSINDYKTFLATLSWDEFRAYKSKVNEDNLSDEMRLALKEEEGKRASVFNNYMSF